MHKDLLKRFAFAENFWQCNFCPLAVADPGGGGEGGSRPPPHDRKFSFFSFVMYQFSPNRLPQWKLVTFFLHKNRPPWLGSGSAPAPSPFNLLVPTPPPTPTRTRRTCLQIQDRRQHTKSSHPSSSKSSNPGSWSVVSRNRRFPLNIDCSLSWKWNGTYLLERRKRRTARAARRFHFVPSTADFRNLDRLAVNSWLCYRPRPVQLKERFF